MASFWPLVGRTSCSEGIRVNLVSPNTERDLILREAEYRYVNRSPISFHPLRRDYSTYRILRLNFTRTTSRDTGALAG